MLIIRHKPISNTLQIETAFMYVHMSVKSGF